MQISGTLKDNVSIFRDGKKILETKANVQEDKIYFGDVDVREQDIVRVSVTKAEYQITDIYSQPHRNKILYKKASVKKVNIK